MPAAQAFRSFFGVRFVAKNQFAWHQVPFSETNCPLGTNVDVVPRFQKLLSANQMDSAMGARHSARKAINLIVIFTLLLTQMKLLA